MSSFVFVKVSGTEVEEQQVCMRDTRETAFVHAITAAGAVFTLGKACARGDLKQCMCNPNQTKVSRKFVGWWGGCSDDVKFGYLKSKEFMDESLVNDPGNLTLAIRQHNYEAGRLAVKKHMIYHCQCHGPTGSCTLRTCWKKMPSFRDVGNRLKNKFERASKAAITEDGRLVVTGFDIFKPPSDEELLYTEQSPNFCTERQKYGSLGTQGRVCNPDSFGSDDCMIMCCGRGYSTTLITVQDECNCQFIYCCEVKCDTCSYMKNVSRCL